MRARIGPVTSRLAPLAIAALGLFGYTSAAQAHPDFGCDSCHVPHNAHDDQAVPLWNPEHTTTTLTGNYTSPTLQADTSGGVDGASKLCLSCHDGTYAHVDADHTIASLEASHPVSFIYDESLAIADGELVDPGDLEPGILDINSKMQCSSCHDVHATAAAAPNLRWPYENAFGANGVTLNNAAFCRNCHNK